MTRYVPRAFGGTLFLPDPPPVTAPPLFVPRAFGGTLLFPRTTVAKNVFVRLNTSAQATNATAMRIKIAILATESFSVRMRVAAQIMIRIPFRTLLLAQVVHVFPLRLSIQIVNSPSLPMRFCLSPFYNDTIILVPQYLHRSS